MVLKVRWKILFIFFTELNWKHQVALVHNVLRV
jgi:hypothetical protein